MKNKKVLLSVGLVVVMIATAVGVTAAYFTAQRTTTANKFTTGTMDLDVDTNGNKVEPFVIENMGDNANIEGSKTWKVKNTGTLPGRLLVRLQNVSNEENSCNDQERAAEAACGSDNLGELGGVITLKLSLDGVDKVESTLATNQQAKIGTDWAALTPSIIMQPNEERTIVAHWATGENEYGNEVQSDSVQFDTNFRLIQLINGPAPAN